ncbi:MAG: tyrosine-type recombinase/integrase [Flavobacteriaceae bacterium]|nr:tyrosine-type recombinase/integrase [Flavobacteriaceae bacterium]
MSISHYIDYIKSERKYSIHTQTAYEKDLLTFQQFCKEQFEVSDIDQIPYSIIRSWVVSLVEAGKTNRTVNRKISVLRSYYNFLLRLETIKVSPLRKHVPLKQSKKVHIPFSEKEIEQLFEENHFEDSYKGILQKTIIEILYSTGIRRAELISLKMNDLSFDSKTIRVVGKRNKERIIPMMNSLELSLKNYIVAAKLNIMYESKSFLLQTEKGKILPVNFVYKTVNDYIGLVSTKVKRSPHMLRHSFATHLLNKGANLNAVKDLLGHASLAATQVYTHTSIDKMKQVYAKSHPRGTEK